MVGEVAAAVAERKHKTFRGYLVVLGGGFCTAQALVGPGRPPRGCKGDLGAVYAELQCEVSPGNGGLRRPAEFQRARSARRRCLSFRANKRGAIGFVDDVKSVTCAHRDFVPGRDDLKVRHARLRAAKAAVAPIHGLDRVNTKRRNRHIQVICKRFRRDIGRRTDGIPGGR